MRKFYVRDENCGLSAHQFLQNISNMLLKNTSSRTFLSSDHQKYLDDAYKSLFEKALT